MGKLYAIRDNWKTANRISQLGLALTVRQIFVDMKNETSDSSDFKSCI